MSKRVDQIVEELCQQGCKAVWRHIETLEAEGRLPDTEDLSDAEAKAVLLELKAIMAVYEGTCSPV